MAEISSILIWLTARLWIWSQGVEIHYVIGQSSNPNLDDNVWFSGRIGHLVAEFYRRKTAKVTFAHQEMNAKAG